VVWHAYRQIELSGTVQLFQSHHPDYNDGGQLRDFIYVQDVVQVIRWLLEARPASGLYNLGTGQARSFLDLSYAIFDVMGLPRKVEFVPTPENIRANYQYYTQADMHKLRAAGYGPDFIGLEEGVLDYVGRFLMELCYR
jgi:ADP-L-glycero-D-manno-heptose 6-epimerase